MERILAQVDARKAELDALRPIPAEYMRNISRYLRLQWSYHSNAIEGNTLTYQETKALLLHDRYIGNKEGRHYREILGHDDVVQSLEALVKDPDFRLTQVYIRELHRQMLADKPYYMPAMTADGQHTQKKITPGEYKQTPNGVLLPNGEMFFYAEPVEVPGLMGNLLEWLYSDEAAALHPVERAALLHYRFIRIHPFDDGNGRMARILMGLELMRAGYAPPIVPVEDKPNYINALRVADATEDAAPFVRYVVEREAAMLDILVNGAKGVNLISLKDIKKEIELLKEIAASRADWVEITHDHADWTILLSTITTLFGKIFEILSDFDEMFYSHRFIIYSYKNNTNLSLDNISGLATFFERDGNNDKLSNIMFAYSFSDFRTIIKNKSNLNTNIDMRIQFEPLRYQITLNYSKAFPMIYPYNYFLDDDDIDNIAKSCVEKVMADIKEYLGMPE